jgi:hypothetical protein
VPHFDGYPAVLVRLDRADRTVLEELLLDAWRRAAPKRALKAYEEGVAPIPGVRPTSR